VSSDPSDSSLFQRRLGPIVERCGDGRRPQQCMDLETVLPQAFGVVDRPFAGVQLTAATNVFVAVTRPRELLGLAARKAVVAAPLIAAAEAQGWKIVDLCAPQLSMTPESNNGLSKGDPTLSARSAP
jgi:hypothetical protein